MFLLDHNYEGKWLVLCNFQAQYIICEMTERCFVDVYKTGKKKVKYFPKKNMYSIFSPSLIGLPS